MTYFHPAFMKYALFVLFALVCSCLAAQKKFEGIIRYRMLSADSSLRVGITAWYKKDKIKFTTVLEKGPAGGDLKNETIILDFKKAAIDRFKDKDKTVEREWMRGKNKKQDIPSLAASGAVKTILGHWCTGYTSGSISKSEKKDGSAVTTAGEIELWYAADLLFPVPDSLLMIQMIPLFTNGHIALGSDIKIQQAAISLILHTEAQEIQPGKLQKSLFRHPRGYQLRYND